MALTNCHECGKDVSTEAKTCPHCGAKPKTPVANALYYIGVFVALIVFVGYCNRQDGTATRSPATATLPATPASTTNIPPNTDFPFETSNHAPRGKWTYQLVPVEVHVW